MKQLNTQVFKLVISIGLVLFGFLGSFTVNAGSSGKADIVTIQAFNGGAYVRLDSAVAQNPDGCPSFGGWYIFLGQDLDATQKSYKEFYATVLSAFTLSKQVGFSLSGCYNGYPLGRGVTLYK